LNELPRKISKYNRSYKKMLNKLMRKNSFYLLISIGICCAAEIKV
jgi:hypothetical protein